MKSQTEIQNKIEMENKYEMKNEYVDFMSDRKFEECMENMMKKYDSALISHEEFIKKDALSILKSVNNTTDEFKALFDMSGHGLTLNSWKTFEIDRAINVGNNSLYVKFHLDILTSVDGWDFYGNSKRIIVNEDNTIFIDIRNLHSTGDSNYKYNLRDKFDKIVKTKPEAMCYRGYIISKNHERNINKPFSLRDRDDHKNIREISGDVIYRIVTGDKYGLYNTFKAAREYLQKTDKYKLRENDEKILDSHQARIFS